MRGLFLEKFFSVLNFRNLHISELWLILVYVATKQIGEQRLKAIQLLLKILETQNRFVIFIHLFCAPYNA